MGPRPASRRGVTRPAGFPEAPAPGVSASKWTGSTPRRRRARTTDAPAIPAPITATPPGSAGSRPCPGKMASRRSRFRPWPGARRTSKPAADRPRRTWPATVKVAARAPGADRAATPCSTSSRQISGLRAGAKPSRNQASARPLQADRASPASIRARSRQARNSGNSIRWKPRRRAGQRDRRASAISDSSGQAARARAASSRVMRWASTLKRCRRPLAGPSRRHSSRRASMLSPVPKPSSPTVKDWRPAQARGRPQPSRKTARDSERPSSAPK